MTVYTCFPGGKAKAFTMSYDDGVLDDLKLLEIMNKYGIKGTFNLNYGYISRKIGPGKRECIPFEDIEKVYEGHEIATHSYSHPTIARCPAVMIAEEILNDRKGLEGITNSPVRGHAYPNGSYSDEVISILKSLGIAYARVVEATGKFDLPRDPYVWKATCHHNDPGLMELAKRFVDFQKKQYLQLMYVWGHSYEYSENNNWEVAESLCSLVGNRDDIWYATNIEIIDYLEAADRLRYGADFSFVYNPSAMSVWISVDDRVVEIPSGKTVKLG